MQRIHCRAVDKGYYKGEEAGVSVAVPKPMTSNAAARGQFDKADFAYDAETDVYFCPAGEKLTNRFTSQQDGKEIKSYASGACSGCVIKAKCTTSKDRRLRRWVKEDVLDRARSRTLGQRSCPIGGPQHDRRASLWHHKIMDGCHALQDANTEKGSDGDGAARAGLQYNPRDEHEGRPSDDRCDEGIRGHIRLQFSTETSGCA